MELNYLFEIGQKVKIAENREEFSTSNYEHEKAMLGKEGIVIERHSYDGCNGNYYDIVVDKMGAVFEEFELNPIMNNG